METIKSQKRRLLDVLNSKFRYGRHQDDELRDHLSARLHNGAFSHAQLFVHSKLSESWHIRLLTVLPGDDQDEIHCSLQEVDPQKCQLKYTALSYVWGDDNQLLPVRCDDAIALVRISVYSALLRFRLTDEPLTMWIDSLCIDQSNTEIAALQERAAQVRIMDKIYSQAIEVLVDLGGCNYAETQLLAHTFETMCQHSISDYAGNIQRGTIPSHLAGLGFSHQFWTSFLNFCRRPWFKRIWVTQEFILAGKVKIYFGRFEMSAEELYTVLHNSIGFLLVQMQIGTNPISKQVAHQITALEVLLASYRTIFMMRCALHPKTCSIEVQRLTSKTKPSTAALLDLSRSMLATDKRDHIYAILGLVCDLDTSRFHVDYLESVSDLTLRMAQYLIRNGHGKYCLARACGINDEGIPSWAPSLYDTEKLQPYGLQQQLPLTEDPSYFCSEYSACAEMQINLSLDPTEMMLKVQGTMVDAIMDFSRPLRNPKNGVQTRVFAEWYGVSFNWVLETFQNWDIDTIKSSLWRAIIGDHGPSSIIRPMEKRKAFDYREDFEQLHEEFYENRTRAAWLRLINHDRLSRSEPQPLSGMCAQMAQGRKIGITEHGRMALIPGKSVHGNEIWIFHGIPVPFVLRRVGEYHYIVGQCYLDGMMRGEAADVLAENHSMVHLK